jgi:hypothetical protein
MHIFEGLFFRGGALRGFNAGVHVYIIAATIKLIFYLPLLRAQAIHFGGAATYTQ